MKPYAQNMFRDASIIVLSILVAIVLARTGVLLDIFGATKEWRVIGSVIAGFFFTSIFTSAPATIALAEFAQANSVFETALFGAIGALIGDFLIFRFIRDSLSEHFMHLLHLEPHHRFHQIFERKLFHWFTPLIGALIIASPLPDELALTMMGFSKTKMRLFVPFSFLANFFGILVIGLIAKAVL